MTSHDAAGSAIGYLYQVRWALLALIRETRVRPDVAITLELLDDVAFDVGGNASDLLQVKHHASRTGHLGDKSVDVWKTLKVWVDGAIARRTDGPILSIVSTGVAASGSAMANLRSAGRKPTVALDLLNAAAASSDNAATKDAREAWLALDPHIRLGIVERLHVYDGQAPIDETDGLIALELSLGAPFGHENPYYNQVLEWWSKVAIDLLLKKRASLSGGELKARLSDIRDFFTADNLPTMVDLSEVDEEVLAAEYGDERFVHQLQWIKVNAVQLRKAVVDYHRAVTQSTKWLDDSLIGVHEIQRFEDNLVDEWERAFADMTQDLGPTATGAEREAAGLGLFRALSASTEVTIRALYDEPFYARGKRHELANVGQVGWHPTFKDMLAALVGPS